MYTPKQQSPIPNESQSTPPRLTQAEKSQRQFPVDFELMTLTKVQKYTKSLKL